VPKPIQVSDGQHARLIELKELRRRVLDREVTIAEIVGILLENYDQTVAREEQQ
jgi:hypothetical protein